MKRRMAGLLLLAALAGAPAVAQPVPDRVSFTGNLVSNEVPVTGAHDFVFTLYDAPTGGNVAWAETQNGLAVTRGLVHATLGSVSPLGPTVLNGAPLFLEVSVDGSTLSPRAALHSVPYAIRAGAASSAAALGTLLPGDVQRRVSGACAGSSAVQSVDADGGVTCVSVAGGTGDIASVTTAAGSGLAGGAASGEVNLSLAPCASGESLKSTGSGWSCQPNPTITGTAPISVSTSGVVGLSTCGASQVYKMNAGGTAWTCAADQNTTYAGAAPINISGTSVSLASCGANQVHKMNAGGTAWTCAADSDTTYAAGSGLLLSGSTLTTDNALVARKDSAAGNQAFDTNTLVLDYANNRVGVGSSTPAYPLDVNGTANVTTSRAGAFTFAATQTGVYFVPGSSFAPLMNSSDEVLSVWATSGFFVSGGTPPHSFTAVAGLNLPDGVTVTALTCYVYDDSVSQNITGMVQLGVNSPGATEPSAFATISVDLTTTGASTAKRAKSSSGPMAFDNANHHGLLLSFGVTGLDSYNLRFYGCEVTYTYAALNH